MGKDIFQFVEELAKNPALRSKFEQEIKRSGLSEGDLKTFFGTEFDGIKKADREKIIKTTEDWGKEEAAKIVLKY